jgi:flagellar biosynthetic protein FliR
LSNVALGIMSRAVPQLNVLTLAFPVQIATGLFVLAVTLPLIAMSFYDWPDAYRTLAGGLIEALMPEAGGGR